MPKINIIEQQSSVNNLGPQPVARGERVTSAIGEAAGAIQRGLGEIQQGLYMERQADALEAQVLKKQEENDAVAWSGKVLSDAHIQWDRNLVERQENAQGEAAGFTPSVLADFDKYAEETLKSAPTDSAKKYLQARFDSLRTSIAGQALTFEANTRRAARVQKIDGMIENNAKSAQDNPDKFPTLYGESLAAIDAMEVPPNEKLKLREKLKSTLPYAAELGRIQRDPKGEAARLRGSVPRIDETGAPAKSSFNDVMKFIFAKEGGYNANDGNGPVNFGINQAANPDIDVKSLTKDGATALYQKRYWNAIDGDSLPPGVALMAMDAAVNQGVGFAQKMLRASGGDINRMAQMRADHYANLVQRNPEKYGKYAANWSSRLQDATAQASALGGSGIGNLDVSNIKPENVKPSGDPAIDALSFDQRIRLLQHADTLANQQMAIAREQLKSKIQDFSAMATSGVAIPPSSMPTVTELQAAYGEAEGIRMYREDIQPMVDLNGDLQRFSTMSVAERNGILTSKAPQPGDGFSDAAKRHAIMVQANDMLNKQMADDPAAYAARYSQPVSQAWTKLQQTPADDMAAKSAAAAAYVNATLAEQQRLGVLSPTVIPKGVAESIVRQFYQQDNGGQNAAVLIQQQAQLWGKHWPAVYGQMAKDLPSSALVIGSGLKPQAAEMLARASTMKQSDLEDGLVKTDITAMKDKLQDALTEFRTSVAPLAGGAQTFNVFNEQITKLATMYMRAGDSASKASERAYHDVIGSKYEFVSNSNNKSVSYRVPLEVDPSAVAKGADRVMATIGAMDIATPPSLAGLNQVQAKTAFVAQIKNDGYWVTAPDNKRNAESGLALYINGAAVLDSKGQPIFRSWDELRASASTRGTGAAGVVKRVPTQEDFEGTANVYGAP